MEEKNKNSIDFVARHYRRGAFSVSDGRKALGFGPTWRRRFLNIAASVAVVVAVTATAAVLISRHDYDRDVKPVAEQVTQQVVETPAPAKVVKVIEFNDAPLADVVDRIKEVYGVEVTGVPDDAASLRLTLRYEGNAGDLVAAINEILGTELELVK